MGKITGDNLSAAYAGESQANMRYQIYAEIAEKEGMPNIARLFRAISYAELVHARNHYKELGKIKSTADNLQIAIDGEDYEVDEMYPAFIDVAKMQGVKGAERSFNFALQAEKIHARMYKKAKEASEAGNDIDLDKVFICPVCGYTHEGSPPDFCPVCGVARDKFLSF
jgi:rubrerythrin